MDIFGFKLSNEQILVCEALGGGISKDIRIVLPTGSGKTLPILLHTILTGRPTIVIAPLLSLITTQVDSNNAVKSKSASSNKIRSPETCEQPDTSATTTSIFEKVSRELKAEAVFNVLKSSELPYSYTVKPEVSKTSTVGEFLHSRTSMEFSTTEKADFEKSLLPSIHLYKGMPAEELKLALTSNKYRLFYMTPEKLYSVSFNKYFISLFRNNGMIVVDESHCVELWRDFRPAYLSICHIRKHVGIPKLIAMTATADARTCTATTTLLELDDPIVIHAPKLPERLIISMHSKGINPMNQLLEVLSRETHSNCNGFVFVFTPKDVDDIFAVLRVSFPGHRVFKYHGGMSDVERAACLTSWRANSLKPSIMISNVSCAMGVDSKSRWVIIFKVPNGVVWLLQMLGRTARRGAVEQCYGDIFVSAEDVESANNVGPMNSEDLDRLKAFVNCRDPRAFLTDFMTTSVATSRIRTLPKVLPPPRLHVVLASGQGVPYTAEEDDMLDEAQAKGLTGKRLRNWWASEGKRRKGRGERIYSRDLPSLRNRKKNKNRR